MNNKGFTLIELIVTIVILAVVMSIGAYSIINIVNGTKQQSYESLIQNIKSAVTSYAMECTYSIENLNNILNMTDNSDFCTKGIDENKGISLGELVKYGYLNGNSKNNSKNYTIVNPKNNKSIADCKVRYTNNNGKIVTRAITTTGSCPTEY